MSLTHRINSLQTKAVKVAVPELQAYSKALVQSPTGTGKTRMGAKIASKYLGDFKKRVLWLTHRQTLLEDAVNTCKTVFTNRSVSVFQGKNRTIDVDILIAMVQTISRNNTLEQFNPDNYELIIVDEAHHTPASSYQKVLNYFENVPVLGLTATVNRPDNLPLHKNFGNIKQITTIDDAINNKLYANPDNDYSQVILTDSALEGVTTINGEYSRKQLDKLYTSEQRNSIIINSYKKYGRKGLDTFGMTRKTICFCINQMHAMRMYSLFNENGIKAAYLVSSAEFQSEKERTKIFNTFKYTNDIEVLCVVDLLNEGVDIPNAGCLLFCRPTRSNIIYTQQLGRGTRFLDKVKENVIVLDFVDNSRKGFHSYILSNIIGKSIPRSRIVTEYINNIDPIQIQQRIDAIQVIREFEASRLPFYKTITEWIEACGKLNIKNREEYYIKYKQDPRLSSLPRSIYSDFYWGMLTNTAKRKNSNERINELFSWSKKYNRRPSRYCGNKQEQSLGNWLYSCRNIPNIEIYNKIYPKANKSLKKELIKEFFKKNKRLPKQGLPNEKKLYQNLRGYCYIKANSYDSDFHKWAVSKGYRSRKMGIKK